MRVITRSLRPFLAAALLLCGCQPPSETTIRFADIAPEQVNPDWPSPDSSEATVRFRWVHYESTPFYSISPKDETIRLEVFEDVVITARIEDVVETDDGQVQITGQIEGEAFSTFWLNASKSGVVGIIQSEDRLFDLFPVEHGIVRIAEIDQSRFPPDIELDERSQFRSPESAMAVSRNAVAMFPRGPTIRVLLLFPNPTYRSYCDLWLRHAIGSAVQFELDRVWRRYARSQVIAECVKYLPQGQDLINYLQNGGVLGNYETVTGKKTYADLFWLENDPGVAKLRDSNKADLVVLIVPVLKWCGVAPTNIPPVIPSEDDNAFAVVQFDCARGNYSVQHELGHLMGMRHNRQAYAADDPAACNFGYLCRVQTTVVGRTVMATYGSCTNLGGAANNCNTRFPFLSTPPSSGDVAELPSNWVCGRPCGLDSPDDWDGSAYNYSQLRQAAGVVSQYR